MTDPIGPARRAVEEQLAESSPALRAFFEQELAHAQAALAVDRSTIGLRVMIVAAADRVAHQLEPLIGEHPVACKRGCSWCCRGIRVEVLAPEALAIGQLLRSSRAPEAVTLLSRALATAGGPARDLSAAERWQAQLPCAFLDEQSGACTIYDARPMVCRRHNSMDVTACERAASGPAQSTTIPRLAGPEILYGLSQAALGCV
jgi:Fe-S-cluster containining protein